MADDAPRIPSTAARAARPDPEIDRRWMRAALALGRRELGRTWPNPAVGCLIVADVAASGPGDPGRLIGRGWTQIGGRPHAEVMALAMAGADAAGATAYITLEPCSHHGVTPPCADALSAAGVARVVSAMEDPDPRVSGGGHARLRARGVAVDVGVCADEAAAAHDGFLAHRRLGRPRTTLKLATSLDGKIALASGESRWITGPAARAEAHALRADHDAILVGAGTARADDPALTVRLPGLERAAPVRVVADSTLSLPLDSRLARTAQHPPLWLLHAPDAPAARRDAFAERGARLLETPRAGDGAGLDPAAMLAALGAEGVTRLFCEGGGALAASLIAAGLADRLIVAAAGLAIGADGRAAVAALDLPGLAQAPRFRLERLRRVGPDVWSEWSAAPKAG